MSDVNKQLLDKLKVLLALHDNEVYTADAWELSMEQAREAITLAEQEVPRELVQQFIPEEIPPTGREQWTVGEWCEHFGGRYKDENPMNYYEFGSMWAIAKMLESFSVTQQRIGWNACITTIRTTLATAEQAQQVGPMTVEWQFRNKDVLGRMSRWNSMSEEEYLSMKENSEHWNGYEIRELYAYPPIALKGDT